MSRIIQNYRIVQRGVNTLSTQWQSHLLTSECASCNLLLHQQRRNYQKPAPKKGFVSKLVENIKDGMAQNKQMQENLKKFKEEKAKLDESDSLKDMKNRLSTIHQLKESASPYLEKIEESVKETTKTVSSTVEKIVKDASDSTILKKGQEVKEDLAKSAKQQAEELEKTESFKTASTAFSKVILLERILEVT